MLSSPDPMFRYVLATVAALVAAGCVGDSKADNIDRCVPGMVAFCGCSNGSLGTQSCETDGRYGECTCGDDTDVGTDVADTTPDGSGDTGGGVDVIDVADGSGDDTGSGRPAAFGEACAIDDDCVDAVCVEFSGGSACTRECLGLCDDDAPDDWVCFNRICTPPDHCDLDASETGVGPGCADARCGGCPPDSDCVEFEFGRYDCVCHEGFSRSLDFATCDDIDECAGGEDICPVNTTCRNTPGTFECDCDPDFWGPECQPCPGGVDNACGGRGTCDDGNDGSGTCECMPRYGGTVCEAECYDVRPATCADADLTDVDFVERNVSTGDFTNAVLTGVGASGANFSNTVIGGADFSDATCVGTRFVGATGAGPRFLGANLDGADLGGAEIPDARFADAIMTNVEFTDGVASGADFTRVDLGGANLSGTSFTEASFLQADLNDALAIGTNLRDANLLDTEFVAADLTSAILAGANCQRADFGGANLSGANLVGADLSHANLEGASLTGSALTDVVWSDTTCPDGSNSDDEGTCIGHF